MIQLLDKLGLFCW